MKIFGIIKSLILSLLGVRVFNPVQKKFYVVDCCVFFAMIFAGAFVNTFIMLGGGIRGVVIYNFIVFGTAGIASFLQAFVIKRFGALKSYRCGIAAYVLFYVSVLILGERINDFIWLAGVLMGISFCFFFVSRNTMILSCADYDQDAEGLYFGSVGITNSIFSLIFPFLVGWFITQMTGIELGTLGYYIVFSIGILMFSLGFVLTFFIPKPKQKNANNNLWQDAKILLRKKSVIFSGLGEMFRGMKDIIGGFIFASLVFYVTQTEFWVGRYATVMAVCQLIGFFIFTRYINLKRAKIFLLIFAITVIVTPFLLLYSTNLWALFIVGGAAFIVHSFQNAANIISSNALRGYTECGFLIREVFLTFGRMIGFSILLYLSDSPQNVAIALLILGAMQMLMWFFHSRVKFKDIS